MECASSSQKGGGWSGRPTRRTSWFCGLRPKISPAWIPFGPKWRIRCDWPRRHEGQIRKQPGVVASVETRDFGASIEFVPLFNAPKARQLAAAIQGARKLAHSKSGGNPDGLIARRHRSTVLQNVDSSRGSLSQCPVASKGHPFTMAE